MGGVNLNYDDSINSGNLSFNRGEGELSLLSLSLDTSTNELRPFIGVVGPDHEWFIVPQYTLLGDDTVNSLSAYHSTLRPSPIDSHLLVENVPFFLGLHLLEGGESVYGWAQLEWDGDEIFSAASAFEDTGEEIVVGTTTSVPEPSSVIMLILGLSSIAFRRKN